jgi:uncharacterized protein
MRALRVVQRLPMLTATALIRCYQRTVSRLLPPTCRFQPSCSQYTLIAIQRFGVLRGLWLGLRRVIRCNPFCQGGHDPVPPVPVPTPRAGERARPKSPV